LAGCGRIGFDPLASDVEGPTPDAGETDPDADPNVPDASPQAPVSITGPGSWAATNASPLAQRSWTSAVWTGTEFLTFGGSLDGDYTPTDTGARYNPATDTWTPMSSVGAAGRRHTPLMVWSGEEMIVYAGGWGLGPIDGGGRYNPSTDTWGPVSETGAPSLRIYGHAVWTGTHMLIWGGWANAPGHYQDGYLYDPSADEWTSISTTGAPSGRSFGTMVWTGSRAIVWGGCDGNMGSCPGAQGDGAIYDPTTDQWSPISNTDAPDARAQHKAVWTGDEMIVFGGQAGANGSGQMNSGAIYNPDTDTWRAISTQGAPSPRCDHAAAWMGDKMLIWGGLGGETDGFLYDPATDEWTAMETSGTPAGRNRFAYAASHDTLFIWGGSLSNDGGIWTPQLTGP
jgi:N-acetylneuraminic acid mutarotase